MKCTEICELLPDLAAGLDTVTPEVNEHLQSCAACAGKLAEFRRTMALLDEWQVPEPTPYFDTRLMARLREVKAQPAGLFSWFRKPVLAASLAVLMVVSGILIRTDGVKGPGPGAMAIVEPGTAVGDLQALEKNGELYSDFEILDDLQVQGEVNANP